MDWKSFISEIVKSLAWPSLLFIGLLLFRKQIIEILNKFAKYPYLRWKRGENELEIGVKQIREETKEISLPEAEKKIFPYLSSAIQDPKTTIQTAWDDFEKTAKESIGVDYTQPFELEYVLKQNFSLPEDKYNLFIKMKDLRNMAVHLPPSGVSPGTAVDFSASALRLSNYLKEHKK